MTWRGKSFSLPCCSHWRGRATHLVWPRLAEFLAICSVLTFLSLLNFGGWLPERVARHLVYCPMIGLIWVCLRFELREVTAVVALLSVTAVWGTSIGVGALGSNALQQSLFDLQILLNTYAVIGLALASIVQGRREADEALRKSYDTLVEEVTKRTRAESWFRQLLSVTPDALLVCNRDGEIVLANETAERLFGYSRNELLGQPIELLVPRHKHEQHRAHRAAYQQSPFCRQMGSGTELTGCGKGGRQFPAEVALGPIETAEGLFVFCAVRDITSRKLSERALRESEERFALAVRGTDAGIWDWDLRNNTVYFSPRWKSMLGYEDHEIRDNFSEWESRLHPEDRERALATVQAYLESESSTYELEHRLRHKDGTYRYILARGAAVRGERARPYRMVGSHIDITRLKHAEAAILARNAELLAAQRIQEHLLPETPPDIPGYDIAGSFHAAEYAAADHFDFLNLPDGSLGVVIGDVSGHGFSSALLMTSAHAAYPLDFRDVRTHRRHPGTRQSGVVWRIPGGPFPDPALGSHRGRVRHVDLHQRWAPGRLCGRRLRRSEGRAAQLDDSTGDRRTDTFHPERSDPARRGGCGVLLYRRFARSHVTQPRTVWSRTCTERSSAHGKTAPLPISSAICTRRCAPTRSANSSWMTSPS